MLFRIATVHHITKAVRSLQLVLNAAAFMLAHMENSVESRITFQMEWTVATYSPDGNKTSSYKPQDLEWCTVNVLKTETHRR